MADNAFEVQVEHAEGAVVVTPHGAVDLDTAPMLEAALRRATRAPRAPVVIDMSDVDFLACRGVGVLATARAELSDAGFPLVVTGARAPVRKVLLLCDGIAPARRPGAPGRERDGCLTIADDPSPGQVA